MNQQVEHCFDQQAFERFLDEQSEAGEETRILAHIGKCQKCRQILERLAGSDQIRQDIQLHLAEHDQETIDLLNDDQQRRQQRDLKTVQDMLGPTDNPEMLGRLGHYEVCGVIGRGSAGIVVKALDSRLNRYVAIKLLAPAYSNNGCSRRRFERECTAIASVKNHNVVPIHTVEEYNGTPYIVMPYVPTGSLQQRIDRQGPLNARDVVCLGMQIANGLAAAHERGIVHRDVKPANVLLDSGIEGAMVSDFGLARVVDEATMTHSGTISGTPQYMSPEQARGERVDQRSDQFSLGSTLYAACTGHAPFTSESVFGIIKKVCDSQPRPIREFNPEIPTWLVAFIDKLHAKDPGDRFESTELVSRLLADELAHMQSPTLAAEPARQWWDRSRPLDKESLLKPETCEKPATAFGSRTWLMYAAVFLTAIAGGLVGSKLMSQGDGSSGKSIAPEFPTIVGNALGNQPFDPLGYAILVQQEQEELARFENQVDAELPVASDGTLFVDSNMGSLQIFTHDKNKVIMKLRHSVAAASKKWADKHLKAVELLYEPDPDNEVYKHYQKGRDAVIRAKFPTRKEQLTEQEILAFDDLEELKEQLLLRNHPNFRSVDFELWVPESLSLNLNTLAGNVAAEAIGGRVVAVSRAGHLTFGDIGGSVNMETHGGHITIGNTSDKASLLTHGGHIELGKVGGVLDAETHGGHIEVISLNADSKLLTHGGRVDVWKAAAAVDVVSHAGPIRLNFVKQPEKDCRIESHVGSVKVGYDDELAFRIEASSGFGAIDAPFLRKPTHGLVVMKLNEATSRLNVVANGGSIKFHEVSEGELDREIEHRRRRDATRAEGKHAFDQAIELHMQGKIDEAIDAHKHAATFEGYQGISTYNLGCAWALKGEKDKAFRALEKAIELGFTVLEQYQTDEDLDSLRKDKRFDELIKQLKEIDDSDERSPSDVNQLLARGRELVRQDDLEQAVEVYRRALQLDPTSANAMANLGYSLHTLGRLDEALVWHKAASQSDNPRFASLGHFNIACVMAMRDAKDQAFESLMEAIDSGLENLEEMLDDDDLRNLHEDERFGKLLREVLDSDAGDTDDNDDDGCPYSCQN